MNEMKLYTIAYLIVVTVAVYFVIDRVQKYETKPYKCQEIDRAPVNSDRKFDIIYCRDNGLVWQDSIWVEPSYFEQRMIRMDLERERKGYGGW